jgi:hypothetical protein
MNTPSPDSPGSSTRPAGPPGIDPTVPNVARIYDYFLSGKDNFASDRAAAEQIIAMEPSVPGHVLSNRQFLGRAVRFLTREAGIRQFLDIGTGLPTQANVHEVAHGVNLDAKVVYVDYDRVVCAHARALLRETEVGVVQADLREPEAVLDNPVTREVLDLSQPVALLMVAILHFVPDEEGPHGIVEKYRDALAPGSYLVVTHGSAGQSAEARHRSDQVRSVYKRTSAPVTPRSKAEIIRFFDGFELVEPGLVGVTEWRPDSETTQLDLPEHEVGFYGGVGRLAG